MSMDILLVEDNPADMRLVREALCEGGLPARLHWVSSGEAALGFLRREGEHASQVTPDLVLLDLNLPGLNGQEVLSEIKIDPQLKRIPVVVLTSSAARRDVLAAYDAHANSYVVKPDDFEQFLALVGIIRSYWHGAVLLPSRAS
jgi:two-component system, chemotaxis family, response regulator Rcp1